MRETEKRKGESKKDLEKVASVSLSPLSKDARRDSNGGCAGTDATLRRLSGHYSVRVEVPPCSSSGWVHAIWHEIRLHRPALSNLSAGFCTYALSFSQMHALLRRLSFLCRLVGTRWLVVGLRRQHAQV